MRLSEYSFKIVWSCPMCGIIYDDLKSLAEAEETVRDHIEESHDTSQIAVSMITDHANIYRRADEIGNE